MKHLKWLFAFVFLSSLSYCVSADYLDSVRELDLRLICVIVWFAPPIVVLLFVLGGVLFSTGSPDNRLTGKNLMMNALLGFFLVLAFLVISKVLVPALDVAACLSGNAAVSQEGSQSGSGIIISMDGSLKKNENTLIQTS